MSGIVGMVNGHAVARDLARALAKLDPRGYDSAGLAVAGPGFAVRKVAGPAGTLSDNLAAPLADREFAGHAGIAHASWSSQDRSQARAADPVVWDGVAVVHNGIVENHLALRRELRADGHGFETDADAEVIPHLIAAARAGGATPEAALRAACERMQGAYALAVLFADAPGRVLVARRGSPMVVARGACGIAVASDLATLAAIADEYAALDDGDVAELSDEGARILDRAGQDARRPWRALEAPDAPQADARAGSHFRREIADQPAVLRRTDAALRSLALPPAVAVAERLLLIGAGPARHAAAAARGWIERFSGLPCDVELASEWPDRAAPPARGTVGVLVSRSGESADMLATTALLHARGVPTVAVVEGRASRLARAADLAWPIEAGPEAGVAATKSFLAQLMALLHLGLAFAAARGTLAPEATREAERALAEAPLACALAEAAEARLVPIAHRIAMAGQVVLTGRGWGAALADEAAAQLRLLARVHAGSVPAGELRHATLAMVTEGVPVLVLASADQHPGKTAASAADARACGGHVVALAEAACAAGLDHAVNEVVALPGRGLAQMFAQAVALQLIARHAAQALGHDADRPRNLAAG